MSAKHTAIEKIETIIGKGTFIEGNITAKSSLRIDGTVSGEIHADGHVVVGKDGRMKGDVFANSLTLEGIMEGNISVSHRIHLVQASQLTGDIQAKIFEVETGAIYNGKSSMLHTESEKTK